MISRTKNEAGVFTQPYIKTYLKTVVIKIMWYSCKGIHKCTKEQKRKSLEIELLSTIRCFMIKMTFSAAGKGNYF